MVRAGHQIVLADDFIRIVNIQLKTGHDSQVVPKLVLEIGYITQMGEHISHNVDDGVGTCLLYTSSVLSALYSSVLPAYIDLLKTRTPDEALDEALALVNNVSKKRLLNNVGSVRLLLQEMEPDVQSEAENGNSFIKLLGKDCLLYTSGNKKIAL